MHIYIYICILYRSISKYKASDYALEGEIKNNSIRAGNFNTPVSYSNKTNKETQALNDTLEQMVLTG